MGSRDFVVGERERTRGEEEPVDGVVSVMLYASSSWGARSEEVEVDRDMGSDITEGQVY